MKFRSGNEIRELFLRFFESKEHRRVHSSSLVPANDPTLLFTNAGMNQFKDLFLGAEKRDYQRATTSQKCVRAGGKHNDLENVGFTRRHHTFFEMLGNFSFGDYFKRDAIRFAWELVTSEEWFGIAKDRLYVTIFEGTADVPRDDEAEKYWLEVGVPKERIGEYGVKDNFWQMGETGPCGPCSEIFYDMGLEAAETPGVDLPFGQDDARYVEIWNLVFMQFDRVIDHYECAEHPERKETHPFICDQMHASGDFMRGAVPVFRLDPLPKPSIDTGMGLERVAAVLQGKVSNFETDLFTPLIMRAAELVDLKPELKPSSGISSVMSSDGEVIGLQEASVYEEGGRKKRWLNELLANASLRIIADHARAVGFLINDGVLPSNEGRGYVLRKILRRAIRHGRLLGQEKPFLFEMVYAVRDEMKDAYPDLVDSADRVRKVVHAEEQQFARVLLEGSKRFDMDVAGLVKPLAYKYQTAFRDAAYGEDEDIDRLFSELESPDPGRAVRFFTAHWALTNVERVLGGNSLTFPGDAAFHLYETYGLPLDFMVEAAHDYGVGFDMEGFERARAEEQARARASWKGGSQKTASPAFRDLPKTVFEGYRQLTSTNCEVLAIVKGGVGVPAAKAGDEVEVVLDHTSFYGDSGGQVGDLGFFLALDGNSVVADVVGCVLPVQGVRAHKAILKQDLAVGDRVNTAVDGARRDAIRRNHTGTHLLHAALRQVLGTHVKQAGSAVHPDRLRFDFSHFSQVAEEELQEIENIVNREVLGNARVETLEDVPIDVAVNEYHAMALFGEKYGDKVRVVRLSDGFSTELCGGTHTGATGEIGLMKLTSEESVSSGVRRIEAISGLGSLDTFRRDFELAQFASSIVSADGNLSEGLKAKLAAQDDELEKLRREIEEMRMKSAAGGLDEAVSRAVEVRGVKVLTHRADELERGQLRTLVDNLKQKLGEGVVVLGSAQPEGKVAMIAGVTPGLTKRIQAGKLVGAIAKIVGGSGGGKPEIAEAGGKDQSQIDAALKAAAEIVGEMLG